METSGAKHARPYHKACKKAGAAGAGERGTWTVRWGQGTFLEPWGELCHVW